MLFIAQEGPLCATFPYNGDKLKRFQDVNKHYLQNTRQRVLEIKMLLNISCISLRIRTRRDLSKYESDTGREDGRKTTIFQHKPNE